MSASVQINSLPANGAVASNAAAQNSEKMAYYALKTTALVF